MTGRCIHSDDVGHYRLSKGKMAALSQLSLPIAPTNPSMQPDSPPGINKKRFSANNGDPIHILLPTSDAICRTQLRLSNIKIT
jgi:hypothetical protein